MASTNHFSSSSTTTTVASQSFTHYICRLMQSHRLFVAFAFILAFSSLICVDAAPSPLLFTGNDLQSEFADPNLVYRLYYMNSMPRQRQSKQSKRDKKYDRNCFFSPVQCMLSYNANANDVIYHPSGR